MAQVQGALAQLAAFPGPPRGGAGGQQPVGAHAAPPLALTAVAIGAMGREEQVEKAKALADAIQKMTADADVLGKEVKDLLAEKGTVETEMNQWNERVRQIQAELPGKMQELQQLAQVQQQKEALKVAAKQQLELYKAQIEQTIRQHELGLDQQLQQQTLELQQAFMQQKSMLDQQASSLTMEYKQRKMQEDMLLRQFEMQAEMQKMHMNMQEEMTMQQQRALQQQQQQQPQMMQATQTALLHQQAAYAAPQYAAAAVPYAPVGLPPEYPMAAGSASYVVPGPVTTVGGPSTVVQGPAARVLDYRGGSLTPGPPVGTFPGAAMPQAGSIYLQPQPVYAQQVLPREVPTYATPVGTASPVTGTGAGAAAFDMIDRNHDGVITRSEWALSGGV
uniref:EF-hand domain-containing protein n=1 Tax=Alexandrium andersonii TaxID=327968 RepID=A0A7S2C5N9_9DINO